MGAKQSKRSVDISGKEAEGAGEVAAAGAGGEGRVEQLADVDALKPQLNGDAHITPPDEHTEKEKQLDSGTPENEKDATTEKEEKKQENGTEKEGTPITNGESEQKESAESAPSSEDSKKPKKEKVKKKWSLRSISFSRKDKPKQEKKQKEEEANKTNGEPEKVPEEAIEATPEADEKVIEEVKTEVETKDEKTPETPVTEPMTNGSSTPESPKVESPITDAEPAVASTEKVRPEPELPAVIEPEQLPVNGLSLEEPIKENSNWTPNEESKLEESTTETTVPAPVPEIPVKTEVCVQQMPLIESTPPPLPANPPPSSVASFAVTTMAPELTNALLANTAETAAPPPPAIPDINADNLNEISDNIQIQLKTEVTSNKNIDDVKKSAEEMSISLEKKTDADNNDVIDVPVAVEQTDFNQECTNIETNLPVKDDVVEVVDQILPKQNLKETIEVVTTNSISSIVPITDENETIVENKVETPVPSAITTNTAKSIDALVEKENKVSLDENTAKVFGTDIQESVDMKLESPESVDDIPLPPPPADDDQDMDQGSDVQETNHIIDSFHANDLETTDIPNDVNEKLIETEPALKIITKDSIDTVTEKTECNGNLESVEFTLEQSTKESPVKVNGSDEDVDIESCKAKAPELSAQSVCIAASGDAAPPDSEPARASPPAPPPAPAHEPQDAFATSEKLADLIPEIPAVPELNTETLQETTSEIAVPAAGGN